jgi:cytochrome b561
MHAGQLVLIFVVVRLVARKLTGVPPELPLPRLQQLGASAVHLLLYAVMIGLPSPASSSPRPVGAMWCSSA